METLAELDKILMFILLPFILLLGFAIFKTTTNLSLSELLEDLPIPNWLKLFLLPALGLLTAIVFAIPEIQSVISGHLILKHFVSPMVFQNEASLITYLIRNYGYFQPIPCTDGWNWLNNPVPRGWKFKCENGNRYIISPPIDTEAIKSDQIKSVTYILSCNQVFLKDKRLYCQVNPYF